MCEEELNEEERRELEDAFKECRALIVAGVSEDEAYENAFIIIRKYYRIRKEWTFQIKGGFEWLRI